MHLNRIVIALVIVADRVAQADPAPVEWTFWLGPGAGIASQPQDGNESVYGFRIGAGVDFELAQFANPLRYGGKFEIRWGPWLIAETRSDTHYVHGGLAIDFGQTRHAQFGTFTLRAGGGIDIDGDPLASLTFLGGVRYVPDRRHSNRKVARASGGRVFGMITSDGNGGRSLLFGIEFEPTWVLPPYSIYKLGGVNHH
jgi:hypothetical protein